MTDLTNWQDKTDPAEFNGRPEDGFFHYRAEYRRLGDLLVNHFDELTRDQRDQIRTEQRHAAARAVGFSYYLLP